MRTWIILVFLTTSLALLSSCARPSLVYEEEMMNLCMVMNDPNTAKSIFGTPRYSLVRNGNGQLIWLYEYNQQILTQDPIYIDTETSVSRNSYPVNTYNVTTTTTASGGGINIHNRLDSYRLGMNVKNGKVIDCTYIRSGYASKGVKTTMFYPVADIMYSCRYDSPSSVKKILEKNNGFITKENMIRGAIEAAKNDNIDVVEYLINEYKLNPDEKTKSWIEIDNKSNMPISATNQVIYGSSKKFKTEAAQLSIREAATRFNSQKTLRLISQ